MRSARSWRFLPRVEHNPCSTARISPRKLRSRLTYSHAGTHSRTCRVAAYVIEHCVMSRRITFCRSLMHIRSIIYLAIFTRYRLTSKLFAKVSWQQNVRKKESLCAKYFLFIVLFYFFFMKYRDREKGD